MWVLVPSGKWVGGSQPWLQPDFLLNRTYSLDPWNGSTQRECVCVNTSKVQVVRQPCATPWTIRSKPSTTLSLVAKLFVSLCDHWCKVARDQHLGFTFTRLHPPCGCCAWNSGIPAKCANKCLWRTTWFTPGSLLVHFWCTPGALLVHSRCMFGALLVHSRCTPKVSRKGIASLPKGSLDPPFRNVWIAFSLTYKPEREMHRFRKEASILRRETFGSPFCQLATRKGIATLPKGSLDPPHRNVWIVFSPTCKPEREIASLPKGSLDPPHRNVWIAQNIITFITGGGVTTTRLQQNTPQTLPTERSMNGPGAHPAQRASGTCRCARTATFILRTAPVALEATAQPGHPIRVRQLGEQ